MNDLPRPRPGCTPSQFYLEYIPAFLRALGVTARPHPLVTTEIRVAEEVFTLSLVNGVLTAQQGPSAGALVCVTSDRPSWEIATLDLWPRVMKRLDWAGIRAGAMVVDAAAVAAVRSQPGLIQLTFTDDAGDTARCSIAIAGGRGPEVHVHAGENDLWALVAARAGWAQLLRSRTRIEGDVAYLLRLLRAGAKPSM